LFLLLKTKINPILEFLQVGNTGNINIGNQIFFPVFTSHGDPIIINQSSAFKGETQASHRLSVFCMTAINIINKKPSGQHTNIL